MNHKTFHVNRLGNLANQMIQYLVAWSVASKVPGCSISNIDLPVWGIRHPAHRTAGLVHPICQMQHVDVLATAHLLRDGGIANVDYTGYGQRLENFPDLDTCRRLFNSELTGKVGFGTDTIVINIRGGDILGAINSGYTLVPIDYYAEIISKTGLRPVFMGQIEHNIYCDELRRRFPHAEFLPSQGPLRDFETLRGSKNIIPSVSTFSWLACWLSHADRIFMPLTGFYNPFQDRLVDLLPLDDDRYAYTLFPINYAVKVEAYAAHHAAIGNLWRDVDAPKLRQLRQAARQAERSRSDYMASFDEAFYLQRYPDVAEAVASARMPTGLYHYAMYGFQEARDPFDLDPVWYTGGYPIAALEIGSGEYIDPIHHYLETGKSRGYQPVPGRNQVSDLQSGRSAGLSDLAA